MIVHDSWWSNGSARSTIIDYHRLSWAVWPGLYNLIYNGCLFINLFTKNIPCRMFEVEKNILQAHTSRKKKSCTYQITPLPPPPPPPKKREKWEMVLELIPFCTTGWYRGDHNSTSNANMAAWQRRLQKELMEIKNKPPPGMRLDCDSVSSNLATWVSGFLVSIL